MLSVMFLHCYKVNILIACMEVNWLNSQVDYGILVHSFSVANGAGREVFGEV